MRIIEVFLKTSITFFVIILPGITENFRVTVQNLQKNFIDPL